MDGEEMHLKELAGHKELEEAAKESQQKLESLLRWVFYIFSFFLSSFLHYFFLTKCYL